jgi:UDP-N-acetylmuramate dehydrogenase
MKTMPPHLKEDTPLDPLSTFRIGGKARYLYRVTSREELRDAFLFCSQHDLPYFILGKGSNILFDDKGFGGVVILNSLTTLSHDKTTYTVAAGHSFSHLGTFTARHNMSGLEFAAGIPASLGGAIYMNAGAHRQNVSDTLQWVDYMHDNGELQRFTKEELTFGYRYSSFHNMKGAILQASFSLTSNDEALSLQKDMLASRMSSQPYDLPSAGCVFRNPSSEQSAGKLIEGCGLKGLSIGGATISDKHANFIVNTGSATSSDVCSLIAHIQEKVYKNTGITLKREICIMPYLPKS